MVVHSCNRSTREANEEYRHKFQDSLDYMARTFLKNKKIK